MAVSGSHSRAGFEKELEAGRKQIYKLNKYKTVLGVHSGLNEVPYGTFYPKKASKWAKNGS